MNDSRSEAEPDDRAKVDHLSPRLWQFPWLVVHDPGSDSSVERRQFFLVSVSPFTIGRSATSSLVCASNSVSRHHASLVSREDGWYVQDAESVNGTFVNGTKSLEAKLQTGSRIRVGDVVYKFVAEGDRTAKVYVLAGQLPPDATPDVSPVAVSPAPNAPPAPDAPTELLNARAAFASNPVPADEVAEERPFVREPQARQAEPEARQAQAQSGPRFAHAAKRFDYKGADLRGANFAAMDCSHRNFEGANLSGANLVGAGLAGANLRNADLSGADLRHCDLECANLREAKLWGANARNAKFDGAWLAGARIASTDLRGATFSGAWLLGLDLQWGRKLIGANLHRAHFSASTLFPKRLYSLQCARPTLFRVWKAGVMARLFGTKYEWESIVPDRNAVVLLRYVGKSAGDGGASALPDESALRPFATWMNEWTSFFAQMDIGGTFRRGPESTRIVSADNSEERDGWRAVVTLTEVDAPMMLIMAAILKVSTTSPMQDDELLRRADKARASVMLMLPALRGYIEVEKDTSHLTDGSTSGFYARCIRAVSDLSRDGGDVALVDAHYMETAIALLRTSV